MQDDLRFQLHTSGPGVADPGCSLLEGGGCNGMATPSFDALANISTVFTKNYVQHAVCSCSRTSLLMKTDDGATSSTVVQPLPTPQQAIYMDTAFSMFVHFGVNTFTADVEHNCDPKRGCVPAKAFAPDRLDTDQWARTAKAMGAYAMCLTAKHEGGYEYSTPAHLLVQRAYTF